MTAILFGGVEPITGGGTGKHSKFDLAEVPLASLITAFEHWLATHYVHAADIPLDETGLRSFDLIGLIPEFRQSYDQGAWLEAQRGETVEERALASMLHWRQPFVCLLSQSFSDQPVSRLPAVLTLTGGNMAELEHAQFEITRTAIQHQLLVYTGQFGHAIRVEGVEPMSDEFQIFDPWPKVSLLAAANNTLGVNVRRDPTNAHRWLLSIEDYARVVVASLVMGRVWQTWTQIEVPRRNEYVAASKSLSQARQTRAKRVAVDGTTISPSSARTVLNPPYDEVMRYRRWVVEPYDWSYHRLRGMVRRAAFTDRDSPEVRETKAGQERHAAIVFANMMDQRGFQSDAKWFRRRSSVDAATLLEWTKRSTLTYKWGG